MLHSSEAMSKTHDGKRIVFCCHLVRFIDRSRGRRGGTHTAVAVGFIMSPLDEEDLDPQILDSIQTCVKQHNMKFLLGTLPKDDNKALGRLLGRMDAASVFSQNFVADRNNELHYPVYAVAFNPIKVISDFAPTEIR